MEVADTLIRMMDLAGRTEVKFTRTSSYFMQWSVSDPLDNHFDLNVMCAWFVTSLIKYKKGEQTAEDLFESYSQAITYGMQLIFLLGHNPIDVIEAKLTFNKTRTDHQLENRMKDGGKKL